MNRALMRAMPVPLSSPPEPARTSKLEKQGHAALSSLLVVDPGQSLSADFLQL